MGDDDRFDDSVLRGLVGLEGDDESEDDYWEGPHESYESYESYESSLSHRYSGWTRPQQFVRRLRHQILVDGRLVDSWTESVEGTRWETWARRFDDERCRHERILPPVPEREPWEEMLTWLDALVGGRPALQGLDVQPLLAAPANSQDPLFDHVSRLVMEAAAEFFPDDALTVLHRALLRLWADGRDLVSNAKSPEHLAGGLCWAIGRANGWFYPTTNLRQKDVQMHLLLGAAMSTTGTSIVRALRDLGPQAPRCPASYPDLLALGDAALLTPETRAALVGWRDKALAAQESSMAKQDRERELAAQEADEMTTATG